MRILFAILVLAGATAASAWAVQSSVPDLSAQYYQRRNCYGAYDLLAEQAKSGSVGEADRAWGKAFEEAGDAGKPCPSPPDALAERASNRIVSTAEGIGRLGAYVKQSEPTALYEASLSVLTGKAPGVDPKDGFGLLKQAADAGQPSAQFFLAMLYVAGKVTGQADYADALPLLEASAKSGHVDSLFQAGNFYKDGISVRADKKRALAYYQAAAERGHAYAAIMAFYMIQDGEGVPKDFNLAYRIARNLADHGQVYGAVLSASALLQQKNAKEHEDEVLYWMDVAIRDGDQDIQGQVGKMRPQVVAAFSRAKAPPEYHPPVRKLCPLKRTCLVDSISGLQSCTTNIDYWNDCDS